MIIIFVNTESTVGLPAAVGDLASKKGREVWEECFAKQFIYDVLKVGCIFTEKYLYIACKVVQYYVILNIIVIPSS